MLYTLLFLSGLPLAATAASEARIDVPGLASGVAQASRSGSWSARTASGRTFMGTWTAVHDTAKGTATGVWTLLGEENVTLATGGWSAAKSPVNWTGAWRANFAGRDGEFSGTWTATTDLAGNAPFVDLFEKALQVIVSGTWRTGGQSGAWSIRAFAREAGS